MGDRARFFADLRRCERYLAELSLHPVCDGAVGPHIIDRIPAERGSDLVGRYGDVLNRVPVLASSEIWDYLGANADAVWVSAACQFGPLWRCEEVSLRPGRLMAAAGFSILSGSYGAMKLYPWTGRPPNGIGGPLVRIANGRLHHLARGRSARATLATGTPLPFSPSGSEAADEVVCGDSLWR